MQFRTWLHLANLCAINSYKRYFCLLSLLQRWHKYTLNAFRGRNCIIYYSICFGRLKFGFAINVSSQVPDQAVCLCVCRWCWRSLSTTRRRARVVRWFRVFCLAWWLKTVWRSRTASPSPSTPKMMSNSMKVRCTAISRAPFSTVNHWWLHSALWEAAREGLFGFQGERTVKRGIVFRLHFFYRVITIRFD